MSTVEMDPQVRTPSIQHYPLDVAALFKGQIITIRELEPILHVTYQGNRDRWGLALMRLKKEIEVERRCLCLPVLTMRNHHGALVVCTDAEAAKYNLRMTKHGIRRIKRAAYRNSAVDIRNLTDDEKRAHDRALGKQAMLLASFRKIAADKRPEISDGGRVTPRMIESHNEH